MRFAVLWNGLPQMGQTLSDIAIPPPTSALSTPPDGGSDEGVVVGSMERFIGILIEKYGGAFPTWLAPVQVRLLPVNDAAHGEYAKKVYEDLRNEGFRVEIDEATEKLGYRLRAAQVEKVPYTVVLGNNEAESGSVTYRIYGKKDQITVSLEEFKKLLHNAIDQKLRF